MSRMSYFEQFPMLSCKYYENNMFFSWLCQLKLVINSSENYMKIPLCVTFETVKINKE